VYQYTVYSISYYSLQYSWTVSGGIRNILTIYSVSKLDKGKQISCRATDHGMISDCLSAMIYLKQELFSYLINNTLIF
jgi:hypothetical protein